jgi:hypothetical protein
LIKVSTPYGHHVFIMFHISWHHQVVLLEAAETARHGVEKFVSSLSSLLGTCWTRWVEDQPMLAEVTQVQYIITCTIQDLVTSYWSFFDPYHTTTLFGCTRKEQTSAFFFLERNFHYAHT